MAYVTGGISTSTNRSITIPEIIGTGDGIATVFALSLSSPAVFLLGVKIEYTVGSTVFTSTSDGFGVFTGTHITSGSVTVGGAIALTFSTAPDDLTSIRALEFDTKGLLHKLLDHVHGAQFTQIVGTGNGVLVTFAFTITNTVIAKGQLRIKYKIGSQVFDVWDNGAGEWISSNISASAIDYTTGICSITFTVAIDDLFAIECLYSTGTAGKDWIIMHDLFTQDSSLADAFPGLALRQVVLKNSGKSFEEPIYIGIRETENVATNQYLLNFNLYKAWDDQHETTDDWNYNKTETTRDLYDATTENWRELPSTAYNDDDQTYFFSSTKNRIIGAVKVSNSVTTSFYLGLGIRYSSRANYPFPLCVIGNNAGNFNFTSTATQHRMFISPGTAFAGLFLDNIDVYRPAFAGQVLSYPTQDYSGSLNLEKITNAKILLSEIFMVYTGSNPDVFLFQLDGAYHAPYVENANEDTVDVGGSIHLVIQDIFRTTTEDFMAFLEE